MKKLIVSAAILATATLLLPHASPAAGLPQSTVEYSADSYMEMNDMIIKSRVYHAKDKERREQNISGTNQVFIVRFDKNLTWMLMPEQKAYMEMDMKEGKKQSKDINDCDIRQKSVGQETVNGLRTTKNKISMTCPGDNAYDGTMWVTKDGIMVKMDATLTGRDVKGTMKIELKNIKIARQDPKLFEIPAGYSKMGLGGLFGAIMQGVPAEAEKKRKEKSRRSSSSSTGRAYSAETQEGGREYSSAGRGYSSAGRAYSAADSSSTGRAYSSAGDSSPALNPVRALKKLFSW